ncbi:FAD:protein FMN transferase [uncultured Desulfovibrio sp.]|uniref:FAD:protein FMN transferase n=1 Tax=uncultured Desulfovibrio sp. TaxID=167968 RepID=UPI0027120BF1|nr:FAD:protein FMN transferase [uncultured Desulfovibrio sp.]
MQLNHSRRYFLRAALLCGGFLGVSSLTPVLLPLTARAASGPEPLQKTRLFMGTVVTVSVVDADAARAEDALERAFARGRALADVFTRFGAASPVAALNSGGMLADAPPELTALLESARRISRLTGGAFDVTVLPLLRLLEERRNPAGSPRLTQSELHAALELVGAEHLEVDSDRLRFARSGMGLTLDGIAKGHIAQCMSRELTAAGCPDHLVNAGGDMVAGGRKGPDAPWRVAVEDPRKRGRYPQVVELPAGGAIATSGGYEVFYDAAQTHSHLVSPATGQSPALASVTVTAPDGLMADALATALSVMPPRDALALADSLPGYACCLLRRDGLMRTSGRWRGRTDARRAV